MKKRMRSGIPRRDPLGILLLNQTEMETMLSGLAARLVGDPVAERAWELSAIGKELASSMWDSAWYSGYPSDRALRPAVRAVQRWIVQHSRSVRPERLDGALDAAIAMVAASENLTAWQELVVVNLLATLGAFSHIHRYRHRRYSRKREHHADGDLFDNHSEPAPAGAAPEGNSFSQVRALLASIKDRQ